MSVAGRFPVRTEIVNKRDYESDENGDFFRSVTIIGEWQKKLFTIKTSTTDEKQDNTPRGRDADDIRTF